MNISGIKIPRMLDYCVGDYASCPVYLSRAPLEPHDAEANNLAE
ncbi:hypothetical protein [Geomesophilobacter sediminis]|nr:hypothetical protein [Geomesophilobacter sediminis]